MRYSLRKRFFIGLLILFLINISFVFSAFVFIKYMENDGYILDIAGKQRMLIQHIAKDVLLVSQGHEEYRSHILQSIKTFDKTLNALMNGGKIVYEKKEIEIPPPANRDLIDQLNIVKNLWEDYKRNSIILLNYPDQSEEYERALNHIVENNEILLVEMDKVVKILSSEYRKKMIYFSSVYLSLFLMSILVYIAIWRTVNKNILMPLNILKGDAKEISSGNIYHKINIPETGDEVEEVAKSISSMVNTLRKMNIELKKAYNKLMELDFLKASIIANVSHELKTPISVIKTLTEIIMEEEKDKNKLEDFRVLKRNIKRLSDLVEDLILISRIAAGKSNLNLEKVNIEEIIKEVILEKEKFAKRRNIEINIEVEPVEIVCDRNLLYRALLNLVDNAIKFNKEKGKIFIKAFKDNGCITIEIKDTGIGIPKDKINAIFEPLIQLDPSIRRKYGGTGLGLALVKRVIEMHKGSISVESELDRGTKFTIKLPLSETK